jgi:diacylglycerol kinase (ATP)
MAFFNLQRRLLSFKYAAKGFKWAFSTQPNIWIHSFASILVIIAGWYFHITRIEWILVIFCIMAVFAMELVNTAIEWLVDSIYKERHEMAGKIKDVAAAAVLITALGAATVGVIIFYPYILFRFFSGGL